jgi:alpha-tubulin suppressor-like RCC1 family protein
VVGAAALLLSSGAAPAFPHARGSAKGLGLRATAIAAGGVHTCALTSAGGVKCWGGNGSGQLGDGTTTARHTLVAVSGLTSGAAALAAGSFHTCALTSAGGVKCWGDNEHTPVAVSGLTSGAAALAAGVDHTFELTSAGGVECWGANYDGQLGDGTTNARQTTVGVSGMARGVRAIAAGGAHTCTLTGAGGVKCWGYNTSGQLGDGTTTARHTPVAVSGMASGVAALSAGSFHTCARTSAGGVKCWGNNRYGQLGDGTTTDRHTPVDVSSASPPCVVPNVIGKLLPKATTAIKQSHCRVGEIAYKRSKTEKNRVLAESPNPGKHLKNGAKVKLTVGRA